MPDEHFRALTDISAWARSSIRHYGLDKIRSDDMERWQAEIVSIAERADEVLADTSTEGADSDD